jgi:sugar/nucleoside kinase (ribokinase family)
LRITFVGHVCVDRNLIRGELETFYGGGVIHGAVTAKRLGAEVAVLTKCAEADREAFTSFREAGVEVTFLSSRTSTSIRNEYPSENPDDRRSSIVSRAEPFSAADLAAIAPGIVHLNPLWYGEFPLHLLPQLRRTATVLGADAQGLLRHVEPDGTMCYRDLRDGREALALLDVFKVDTREAQILTGLTDVRAAAAAVRALGPGVVVLTHRDGLCVHDGQEFYESPFTGFTVEGRTGRGDTCTSAFLVGMQRMGLREATALAAEVTSKKMQYRGAYRGS